MYTKNRAESSQPCFLYVQYFYLCCHYCPVKAGKSVFEIVET